MADKTKGNTTTVDISGNPLKRGDKEYIEIVIDEPQNGAMKGLRLAAIMELDVTQLSILLPRITTPAITKTEFLNFKMNTQANLGAGVLDFLE